MYFSKIVFHNSQILLFFTKIVFVFCEFVFLFPKIVFLRILDLANNRKIGAGIFGHPPNVGYVAKSGPTGLNFGAMDTEFKGEADSGIRFAPKCDFHAYLEKFGYSGRERKWPATWPEQLELS